MERGTFTFRVQELQTITRSHALIKIRLADVGEVRLTQLSESEALALEAELIGYLNA